MNIRQQILFDDLVRQTAIKYKKLMEQMPLSDTFRKQYKELHIEVKKHIQEIKSQAETLEAFLERTNVICEYDEHCMDLAKINLEQAVMWAIKAIT